MLRNVVPPPLPEMILSMLMPSCRKYPIFRATAHGNVAVTRPYWLTANSEADTCRHEICSARSARLTTAERLHAIIVSSPERLNNYGIFEGDSEGGCTS